MSTRQSAAIITGGSRGIGLGIARMLASRGWSLTLTARGAEALEIAVAELSRDTEVRSVAGDMSDEAHVAALVGGHVEAFGTLDALVLAAGVGSAGPIADYPSRRLDRQLEVNFRAPFLLSAAAIPAMREGAHVLAGGVARVIAIASLEGIFPEPGLAAYGATKSALLSLVTSINAEERLNGVVATAISPGYVDTAMSDWVADVIDKDSMLRVDDVVRCVELLLDVSPQAVIPQIALHRRAADPYRA